MNSSSATIHPRPAVGNSCRCNTRASICPQTFYNQHLQTPLVSVHFKAFKTRNSRLQPPQNQYLRTPLASVAFKEVITLLDAPLTGKSPYNFFRCNTYKKQGGRVFSCFIFSPSGSAILRKTPSLAPIRPTSANSSQAASLHGSQDTDHRTRVTRLPTSSRPSQKGPNRRKITYAVV
jgi:hypothetical protein